jgi:hypothetical protein
MAALVAANDGDPHRQSISLSASYSVVAALYRSVMIVRMSCAITRSAKIATLAAIVTIAVIWGLGSSPWSVMTTLRHTASGPGRAFSVCAQTLRIRLQGVDAPANLSKTIGTRLGIA